MSKFNVGDKVRVKDWDELVEEFGLTEDGDIDNDGFIFEMKEFCGMETVIENILFHDNDPWIFLENGESFAFSESELIKL